MFSMASYACSAKKIIKEIYNIFHVQLFELSTGGGGGGGLLMHFVIYHIRSSIVLTCSIATYLMCLLNILKS